MRGKLLLASEEEKKKHLPVATILFIQITESLLSDSAPPFMCRGCVLLDFILPLLNSVGLT